MRVIDYGPPARGAVPEDVDVGHALIILLGQSNADGRGLISDLAASPLDADPELETYADAAFDRAFIWGGSAFAALNIGTNNGGLNPAPGSGTQFGPEFGLSVRWDREAVAGRNLYFVKLGVSGASITSFNPEPTYDNYQLIDTEMGQVFTALSGAGITIGQTAFVWVLGETDYLQSQGTHQPLLQALLDAAVTDGWFAATDKQLLFQMGTTSTFYGAGVAAAKAAIAAADPDYVKAPASPNYYGDGYHQNARGQVQMGYDAFALIFNRSTITV